MPKPNVNTQNSPGTLVLQWLTYAFWGWLILALIWLAAVVLSNFILDEPVSEMIPYAIAASFVLLPLAFVTDLFYRKHEPLKKSGGAAIIMIVHAVIFALLGIVSLIVTVFTALNLAIESGGTDGRIVAISTLAFATVLYATAFLRTINPFKNNKPLLIYGLSMIALTILLLIAAIVGPLAKSVATRNDRLIEQNISYVESAISNYVSENKELPNSLDDLQINNRDASVLVENGLIEYKQYPSVTKTTITGTSTEHRYQLCVEYSHEKTDSYYDHQPEEEYGTYISTSSHDAGKECYKLQATTYGFGASIDK